MRIIFTDDTGTPLSEVLAVSRDHWDACLIGHELISLGLAGAATDFMVRPIAESHGIMATIDVNGMSALQQRLRTG